VQLAAMDEATTDLLPALEQLEGALAAKAAEFADIVKSGRTHLMDAVPVTLGQEFGGYAAQVRAARARVASALASVGQLPLGGTAVGTGINAPKRFASLTIARLAVELELPLVEAPDHFAAQAARDALVGLSGDLRVVAVALAKVADDIRWMSSGPHAGLAELHLPDLQPGSSIMPGKVNPVLCEAVLQVVAQVVGNDAAIAWAGARGNFELNVHLPVIARNLLESIEILTSACTLLAEKTIDGVEANEENLRRHAESTPAIATALNPFIGYDAATEIVKEAVASRRTIREVAIEKGVDEETLDKALDLRKMARGTDTG
jgi:fumarate hydratase class II